MLDALTPRLRDVVEASHAPVIIGKGTYGVVTKGVLRASKEEVALKHSEPHLWMYTMQEIKALASLRHHNVVRLIGVATDEDGMVTLIMEFAAQGSLADILKDPKQLSEAVAKGAVQQLLHAVCYMHGSDWAHLDIHPGNILVNSKGEVKLADFGLATDTRPKTDCNVIVALYRPPEIEQGKANEYSPAAADMWSVGCVLAELVFGDPLFKSTNAEMLGELHVEYTKNGAAYIRKMYGGAKLDSVRSSESVINLIIRLANADPAARCTASEALADPWFRQAPTPAMHGCGKP
jgi:serine/threonine protein kinase